MNWAKECINGMKEAQKRTLPNKKKQECRDNVLPPFHLAYGKSVHEPQHSWTSNNGYVEKEHGDKDKGYKNSVKE